MNILKIYCTYQLPKELQLHMLRTAAVAKNLCDNWKGPDIDKDEIVEAMLLHDMGNFTKINPDSDIFNYSDEERGILRKQKSEFIRMYGKDDYDASKKIAIELGEGDRVKDLIFNLGFRKNHHTVNSNDYSLKICAYSDQRVGPFGVLKLEERIEEAKKRYNNIFPTLEKGITSEMLIESAFEIEKQVLRFTSLDLREVEKNTKLLKNYIVK